MLLRTAERGGHIGRTLEDKEDGMWEGFWDEEEKPFAVRLHPKAGAGVLFHGNLWHAGAPTISGIRYLLVASLNPN